MKSTTWFVRTHKRRSFSVRSPEDCVGRSTLSFAALMILICLANPVLHGTPCGAAQSQATELGAASDEASEYCSTDTPKAIVDKGTIRDALSVSDTGQIIDLNVKVNVTHRWNSHLDVYLVAPDGTLVELFTDVGGMSRNFQNTILDDEAPQSITEGSGPFTGSYRPEASLADLIGKDIGGTWTLQVSDDTSGDAGTLDSWCLIATVELRQPLPAPVIQTQASVPGGIRDVVSWDDVGETHEYESTAVEAIPGQGTLTQTLVVDDSGMIQDLDVKLNINHEWDSELDVYLIAPDGTRIELFTDVGGSQDNFIDTILDDQAPTPITDGTAPFTGRYRPEGMLDDLVGKDIHGQWKLEVTDDSSYASGTLNSWSLIADLADVLYYVESAADAGFGAVEADSGWTVNQSHTFPDLDPEKEHWYRAKARPLKTWAQTSQTDFATDVLTTTEASADGDVVLPSRGESLGPQVHVISNPGFEAESSWIAASNNLILLLLGMGGVPRDILWASEGNWSAGVLFDDDYYYYQGDYGDWRQSVDWTGVDTLVLDYCTIYASQLTCKVLIGDTEVWSRPGTSQYKDVRTDVRIDVSRFTGQQVLKLRVEVNRGGRFLAGVLWDNLRTYGPGSPPSGTIISTPISIGAADIYDLLVFDATIPPGTELTVDVLPETGSDPIAGYENVLSGTDLSSLADRTIRLRANFSRSNPAVTPALHNWSVSYSDSSRESDWSNVESSRP